MSTPLSPRTPGSPGAQATKQLLDELDALMQRMLALPVNELGEELEEDARDSVAEEVRGATATATAPPPPIVDRPGATPAADAGPDAPTVVPEVFGTRLISPHPASPSLPPPHWHDNNSSAQAAPEETAPAPEPAAFPPLGFWPHPALQAPEDREAAPPEPPLKAVPPRSPGLPPPRRPAFFSNRTVPAPQRLAGWWFRSLLWSNRTFDHYTIWLGRPGRWLQGRIGRATLGWFGIGLLVAAGIWGLSNWFGWTW